VTQKGLMPYLTLMLKLKLSPPLPLMTVPAPGWAGGGLDSVDGYASV